jgi:hypothetical protein
VSASKGKRYERELVRKFNKCAGLTAERVPRSVADATAIDDVVIVPRDLPGRDDINDNRPITTRLQRQELTLDHILQVEVKYTSTNGYALTTLRDAHEGVVPLDWEGSLTWSDGWRTGGVSSLHCYIKGRTGRPAPEELGRKPKGKNNSLPKTPTDVYRNNDVDAVAFREPREDWLLLWRRDGSIEKLEVPGGDDDG